MAEVAMTIDVITLRGTGNERGVFKGMTGAVASRLDGDRFHFQECNYPATIGQVGAGDGIPAYPLDVSVELGVKYLAWQVRKSPNRVGLISYSLGGIVAMRFLEGVAKGLYRNTDGSPLDVAFHVGIASPSRNEGDSVIPAPGLSGLHSSHGPLPAGMLNLELANPRDIITAAPRFSPARQIAGSLSPFAALEARQSDPFADIRRIQQADWLARFRPGRYLKAAIGLGEYLIPNPTTRTTSHTLYATALMPGQQVTWTDWAAREINRRYA